MNVSDLIFVGLPKVVVAIHRDTGQTIWSQSLKRGYATLLLDGDRLVVSINGYVYCLNPLTGQVLWQNPLTGMGLGVASMTSTRGGKSGDDLLLESAEAADRATSNTGMHHGTTTGT